MARGITESDVHAAADALVALGERPTVERIRAHLGTGSPNTVVRWLETWWRELGTRLAQNDQIRVVTANVPEAVAALAGQWWALALDHARNHADEAIASERATLLSARDELERDRHSIQAELGRLRGEAEVAHHAEQLATARAGELERLVAQLQQQLDEFCQQRDAATLRVSEVERACEALQIQLQHVQEAARAERDTLTQHVRATEDRAHAEVDRARQETKEAQQQLMSLRKEVAMTERLHGEELERAKATVSQTRQELTVQQARADALEAQLAKLNDLPAALEAAWYQRVGHGQPKPPKPARSRRSRGKVAAT